MNTPADALTYVYAVARPTPPLREALARMSGIDRAPVRLLPDAEEDAAHAEADTVSGAETGAGLAFVISEVPRRDFNETALKDHFEDLQWLENVARAHHDVVQAVAARTAVLPLRMATVYQDGDRARQALAAQRSTFSERLAQLEAHTEFGVKIYLPAPTSPTDEQSPAPAGPSSAPASPGKAYLQRRRAQHHARETVYQQAQTAAEAIEVIAARHASQRVRHAPQSGALTGPRENVLNDAYLVPDEQAEQFRSAIVQAAQDFPDIRIEVTGPWAPYSFAMPPPPGTQATAEAPDPAGPPDPADAQGRADLHKRAP
ncbi:GvpL/GvpF family gas vesicle protein [Streptomyces sp. NPDC002587]